MSTSSLRDPSVAPVLEAFAEKSSHVVLAPVRFVGFWSAVLLPFVLFPMLLTGTASERFLLFVALVAANLVALVAGRGYKRD